MKARVLGNLWRRLCLFLSLLACFCRSPRLSFGFFRTQTLPSHVYLLESGGESEKHRKRVIIAATGSAIMYGQGVQLAGIREEDALQIAFSLHISLPKILKDFPLFIKSMVAATLAKCFRIEDPVYGCVGIISKLYEQIRNTEIELAQVQTQITCHKLQLPHPKNAETNFNVLSTMEVEPNFRIPAAQSSNPREFQRPIQVHWFN
ncbi:unnamed protein product [Sphenostylis stenocarpa]|uniref:LOB domain-containing protein n=1 Tax=Sphenostylis stenocarpa TaxID=92480 RepID=A0AA86W024_9FABA|nr:unnamed protein product [Sphenostylis stenocarpa]